MKRVIYISLSLIILLAISFACKKRYQYPIIPEIKYDRHDTNFGLDSLGNQAKLLNLYITFSDGDGDLGIEELFSTNDTSKIYMTLYKKENNIYTEINRDLLTPIFISSVMANDTFLKDWIISGEEDVDKIIEYAIVGIAITARDTSNTVPKKPARKKPNRKNIK